MITNGEFVSRIVNGIKAYTKDGHISRRFILGIGKVKARFLMAQKLDELTLFREDGIISTIDCFKMKSVETKECDIFEFRLCTNLMKSVNKLPDGLFGKNGAGIVSVMSIDGSKVYDFTTPTRYSGRKNRKYTRQITGSYYIKDGYLYLPDSTNELVEVRIFSLDKTQVEDSCECSKDKKKSCKSKWETEFVCPDRFLDLVLRDTLQEVASIFRATPADENPNLDENQKSQTTR